MLKIAMALMFVSGAAMADIPSPAKAPKAGDKFSCVVKRSEEGAKDAAEACKGGLAVSSDSSVHMACCPDSAGTLDGGDGGAKPR